jgi:hypothetical protein
MQERIASPFWCTVHAPQSAMPQPNFVPVSPATSRKYHNSGISGSPSNVLSFPFTFRRIIVPPVASLFPLQRPMLDKLISIS